MPKLKCASFFAGVGGIDLGFEQTGEFEVVYANELDDNAVKTYEANHKVKVDHRSIENVKPKEVPKVDVYLAGFPCSDVSISGYQRGLFNADGTLTRSGLYYELLRLIKANKPPIVFIENVKNLVSHNNGETFKVIRKSLEDEGYKLKYAVLNAMDYGNVPQNRERIYIVAFRNVKPFKNFVFPDPIDLTNTLETVLDHQNKVDDKYYYTEKCAFYDQLKASMTRKDTVYQWRRVYVRENKSNVCPTLTANMGTGGHNVPLIQTDYGIRKLTPLECFKIQGFPADFNLPDIANAHLYKQAGNSVVVPVIRRIAEQIKQALQ